MGAAATATLMRNALKHAAVQSPDLSARAITRDRFEYRYAVPTSWNSASPDSAASLELLMRQLQPLLFELTGPVVIQSPARSGKTVLTLQMLSTLRASSGSVCASAPCPSRR
jgi:hypothetical protein